MDRVVLPEVAARSLSTDRIDGSQRPRVELGARDLADRSADLTVSASEEDVARFQIVVGPAAGDDRLSGIDGHDECSPQRSNVSRRDTPDPGPAWSVG